MPFDIRQLRYAIASADHGSFYRAARALDIEQSTLSRNVIKLERVVGIQIFNRSRAGVTATIAGAEFLRNARPLVAGADRLLITARAAGQGRAGGLVIGHNNAVSAGHLRATILGFHAANPDVEIDGVEAGRGALLASLDSGHVDIAVLIGHADHAGFRREAFWSERVFVALSSDHALAERPHLYWTDLRAERFLLTAADPGPDIHAMLTAHLATSGTQPDIKVHHSSRESIFSLLGANIGVSITCEGGIGAQFPDVVYRPIHGEHGQVLIGYSGYWREDNANPALRRFLDFLANRYSLPPLRGAHANSHALSS